MATGNWFDASTSQLNSYIVCWHCWSVHQMCGYVRMLYSSFSNSGDDVEKPLAWLFFTAAFVTQLFIHI